MFRTLEERNNRQRVEKHFPCDLILHLHVLEEVRDPCQPSNSIGCVMRDTMYIEVLRWLDMKHYHHDLVLETCADSTNSRLQLETAALFCISLRERHDCHLR